jgi:hypothetical protein
MREEGSKDPFVGEEKKGGVKCKKNMPAGMECRWTYDAASIKFRGSKIYF